MISFFWILLIATIVNSVPVVNKELGDHLVERYGSFDYSIPSDTFVNDDGSTLYMSMEENDWISYTYENPSVESRYGFVSISDFKIVGNNLYICDDKYGLRIFDATDFNNLQPLGNLMTEFLDEDNGEKSTPESIEISEDEQYAYLVDDRDLVIIDISDKQNPSLVSRYHKSDVVSVFLKGDLVFIGSDTGDFVLEMVDVTDKSSPVLVDRYLDEEVSLDYAECVYVTDDLMVYVCDRSDGVRIFNASNAKLEYVGRVDTFRSVAITYENDNLYVSDYSAGMKVINVSDPTDPDLFLSFDTGYLGYVVDTALKNDSIVFAVSSYFGVYIFNFSDYTNPILMSEVEVTESRSLKIQLSQEQGVEYAYLMVSGYYGDRIVKIDITNLTNPYIVNNVSVPSNRKFMGNNMEGMILTDDYLVVSDYNSIKIFDVVSDRYNPKLVGEYGNIYGDISWPTYDHILLSEDERLLYSVCLACGIFVFSLTPSDEGSVDIELVYSQDDWYYQYDFLIDFEREILYMGTKNDNSQHFLSILDISNSSHFVTVHEVEFGGRLEGVKFGADRDTLYLIIDDIGLVSLDVSDPLQPEILGSVYMDEPRGLMYADGYVYAAEVYSGVLIIDVTSDVYNPYVIGSSPSHAIGQPYDVFVKDDFAFVSDYTYCRLVVLDVSSKENPEVLFQVNNIRGTMVLTVKDNIVYVGSYGFVVVRMDLVVKGRDPNFDYFCGSTDIVVVGEDMGGAASSSFQVTREDYCNQHGTCLPDYECSCDDGFESSNCEAWTCDSIDFKSYGKVCNSHGNCLSPNECQCDGGYAGDFCSTNLLYATVMAPVLTVSGIIGFFLVFVIGIIICILCCLCLGLIVVGICGLIVVVFRQCLNLRRYGRLKNFDVLLKEQQLEEDESIAHIRIDRSLFEIPMEEIKLQRILGEGGSSSVVYLAIWKNKKVAFKCFKTRAVCSSQESFDEFEKEIAVLGSISHPNVIQCYGCSLEPPRVGIVIEYCSNGDLRVFLQRYSELNKTSYPIREKIRVLREISCSCEYIHSRNVIHRDLKLENVLLDDKETSKLMDFGLSRMVDRMSKVKTKGIGTCYFMAPEITLSGEYDQKVDVFSFGMMMWIVATEMFLPFGMEESFSGRTEIRMATDPNFRPGWSKKKTGEEGGHRMKISDAVEGRDVDLDEGFDLDWYEKLMRRCWDHDPLNRPEFNEVSKIFFQNSVEGEDDDKNKRKTWMEVEKDYLVKQEKEVVVEEEEVEHVGDLKKLIESQRIEIEEMKRENEELKASLLEVQKVE